MAAGVSDEAAIVDGDGGAAIDAVCAEHDAASRVQVGHVVTVESTCVGKESDPVGMYGAQC